MSSVEDAFRPAFNEIERRRSAVTGMGDSSEMSHFARDDSARHIPLTLPGQTLALVTMGTQVLAPRPLDPRRPALRIYGAFETREETLEHATVIKDLDPTCSLVAVRMREWFLMPQDETTRDDVNARRARIETHLLRVTAQEEQARTAFAHRTGHEDEMADSAVSETKNTSVATNDETSRRIDEEDGTADAERLVYPPPRRLRTGGEVRGQSAVALSIIRDHVDGECLIKIHGLFESATDANAWVRNVGSRQTTDHDIHVAAACEWLYPNDATNGDTHYRVDELQRIMDASDRNVQGVIDYKTWKVEQDRLEAEEKRETPDATTAACEMEDSTTE